MTNIGNEFSGLPMADLIGAPLTAACNAQVMLAKATADFINTVGFTQVADPKDATKKQMIPRQVDFSFWRPLPAAKDPTKAADPNYDPTTDNSISDVQKVVLSVPLLAIINVPALMVKSVDITFDMEIKSSETSKESEDKSIGFDASLKAGWGPVSLEAKVSGSVASHKENTRSTDKSAKYHVEVHARDDGMPEGLSRVLDMMQSAIAPLAVGKKTDPKSANIATNSLPTA